MVYLEHMLEIARLAIELVHLIQVIGEAARRVLQKFGVYWGQSIVSQWNIQRFLEIEGWVPVQ